MTLKPLAPWIVCTADLDQKSRYYLPGVDKPIFIANEWNNNIRDKNPNIARVRYIPDDPEIMGYQYEKKAKYYSQVLKPGDDIYVQHFQLVDHEYKSMSKWKDDDGEDLFFVNFNEIYFKFDSTMGIQPLSDYIILERIPDVNKSSIIAAAKPECRAVVRFIAPDVTFVKVGDIVTYLPWADYEFEYEGKTYIKMRQEEAVMVYKMGGLIKPIPSW